MSAATVHEIRNRLQGLMVEVAILRRAAAPTGEANHRATTLVNEAAALLGVYPQLLPAPDLTGNCTLEEGRRLFDEQAVAAPPALWSARVGCRQEALVFHFGILFAEALPERGFMPTHAALEDVGAAHIGLVITLRAVASAPSANRHAWLLVQQLTRDLGGSIALDVAAPPKLRLTLPSG